MKGLPLHVDCFVPKGQEPVHKDTSSVQEVVDGDKDETSLVPGFLRAALVAKLVDDSLSEIVLDIAEGGSGGRLVSNKSATNVDLWKIVNSGEDGFGLYPNVVSGGATEWEDGRKPRGVL